MSLYSTTVDMSFEDQERLILETIKMLNDKCPDALTAISEIYIEASEDAKTGKICTVWY